MTKGCARSLLHGSAIKFKQRTRECLNFLEIYLRASVRALQIVPHLDPRAALCAGAACYLCAASRVAPLHSRWKRSIKELTCANEQSTMSCQSPIEQQQSSTARYSLAARDCLLVVSSCAQQANHRRAQLNLLVATCAIERLHFV